MSVVRSDSTMTPALLTAHRYHDWVFSSFADLLRPGPTLEVGSGHGQFSRRLLARVPRLIVSDIDPLAIDRIRELLADEPRVRFMVMDGVDGERLGEPMDNVVLLNVLEHIEDDAALSARCRECLVPGGRLVVFVPAFARLYGRMDREAGHYRRYHRAGLRRLLEGQGFAVARARYFNAVGFFGWWLNKWLGSGIHSSSTNAQVRLYDRLLPIFRPCDRLLGCIGQSLVVVATKR